MAKGQLRLAIEDFMRTNPFTEGVKEWWEKFITRLSEANGAVMQAFADPLQWKILLYPWIAVEIWAYALFGWGEKTPYLLRRKPSEMAGDAVNAYANLWEQIFSAQGVSDINRLIGTLITEPILQQFETLNSDENADPKAGVRAFHAMLAQMYFAPTLVASALDAIPGLDSKAFVEFLKQLYWNFGIGFLGWQTLSPVMEVTMGEQLKRYYAEKFRPARFGAGELRDLFSLGRISEGELRSEAAKLGWRDKDIQDWLDLAYRQLSQGDIFTLYHLGLFSADQASARLQALGYNAADIPLLFQINEKGDIQDARSLTLTTARKAFREQLLSESEFREALLALNRSEREADLLIAIEKAGIEQETRALTVAQVKTAWENNILSDAEVSHWLAEQNFGQAEVDILLKSWKAELAPPFVKLNKNTIIGAYVAGILSRPEAGNKLADIGLKTEDADLELDLAEARNPEAFGAPVPAPHRYLTPGLLADLVITGLIVPVIMSQKLVEAGYSQEDSDLLAQAATLTSKTAPQPVTQRTVERAYLVGVLDREQAESRLYELGFDQDDIIVILNTVEAENPSVFAPESIQSLRIPTITTLVNALQNEIIDEQTFYDKALEIGYRPNDAAMYLAIATRQERKSTKELTTSQVLQAYRETILPRGEAQSRLLTQGYNDIDTDILMRLYRPELEQSEPWANLLANLIQPIDAFNQLFAMGYTETEVNAAIQELEK